MNSTIRSTTLFSLLITAFFSFLLLGCDPSYDMATPDGKPIATKRKPKDPPPPPVVYFYFDNCSNPTTTGNFVVGTPTNATVLMHYINSPGGNYPAYTSPTVAGVTFSTPAGTLPAGSGTILYTASGTPTAAGFHQTTLDIDLGNFIACNMLFLVVNAPPQGPCSDPGPTPGSTGCVTFTYRGQEVTYQTVRANDGKIWFQHNLGSPQVAYASNDYGSYGHYFQWGRWDDGHQLTNSSAVNGSSTLQNPSHIPNGNPNFIFGSTNATSWWGIGGASTDTWSSSPPSTTNGFDPATAVGPGWRIPTAAEWTTIMDQEGIFDNFSAFTSNLKLTESGLRYSNDGTLYQNWNGGNYWSSTATADNNAYYFHFDEAYNFFVQPAGRGNGFNLRFVKD